MRYHGSSTYATAMTTYCRAGKSVSCRPSLDVVTAQATHRGHDQEDEAGHLGQDQVKQRRGLEGIKFAVLWNHLGWLTPPKKYFGFLGGSVNSACCRMEPAAPTVVGPTPDLAPGTPFHLWLAHLPLFLDCTVLALRASYVLS
jgi:hypothetical protein